MCRRMRMQWIRAYFAGARCSSRPTPSMMRGLTSPSKRPFTLSNGFEKIPGMSSDFILSWWGYPSGNSRKNVKI